MTITYQEYKDKYKHLQQIQLASRVLDHWENYSLHEIVTHKSGLNDLISGLRDEPFMLNKHKLERWFYKTDWSFLTAAHGGICAIIHTQGCTHIPEMSTNVIHFTKHLNKMI